MLVMAWQLPQSNCIYLVLAGRIKQHTTIPRSRVPTTGPVKYSLPFNPILLSRGNSGRSGFHSNFSDGRSKPVIVRLYDIVGMGVALFSDLWWD